MALLGCAHEPAIGLSPPDPPAPDAAAPDAAAPRPTATTDAGLSEDELWSPAARAGARVRLVPTKDRWFLGDNILVHYEVHNEGRTPFLVGQGGDYRGASRHLRFRVVATGPDGEPAADPNPTAYCMGGMVAAFRVEPGESYQETVPLVPYARFVRPGTYRIRVAHDLGWKSAGQPRPSSESVVILPSDPRWAETSIELVMPNAAQAEAVVKGMDALPLDPNRSLGERSIPFADYACLRYPVYLPILERRLGSGQGRTEAMFGIAQMPTPQATEALIRLAGHADQALAKRALGALSYRLPDPQLRGALPQRNPFHDDQIPQRQYLVERSWKPVFAGSIRRIAKQQLAKRTVEAVRSGAFLLTAVGTKADTPAIVGALDWAIGNTTKLPLESDRYPRPRGACQELERAAKMMLERGSKAPAAPRSPGEITFYLLAHGPSQSGRPASFVSRAAGWLAHPIPYVRELVLTHTAPPLAEPLLRRLPELLRSSRVDLSIAACRAAEQSKDARFRPDVLAVMRAAKDDWLIRAAGNAALAVGVPRAERVAVWIERLGDEAVTMRAFDQLLELVEVTNGHGMQGKPDSAEARRLHARWQRFLAAERDAIAKGRKYRIGDPELTVDLLPKGFVLNLKGGATWPPRQRP